MLVKLLFYLSLSGRWLMLQQQRMQRARSIRLLFVLHSSCAYSKGTARRGCRGVNCQQPDKARMSVATQRPKMARLNLGSGVGLRCYYDCFRRVVETARQYHALHCQYSRSTAVRKILREPRVRVVRVAARRFRAFTVKVKAHCAKTLFAQTSFPFPLYTILTSGSGLGSNLGSLPAFEVNPKWSKPLLIPLCTIFIAAVVRGHVNARCQERVGNLIR